MGETVRCGYIASLVQKLDLDIAVYDLETTGLFSFRATEIAVMAITRGMQRVSFATLIDPQKPIDPKASEVTGISNAMVVGKPHWGEKIAPWFKSRVETTLFCGFNNMSYDNPGVVRISKEYGVDVEFRHSWDVRNLHLRLSEAESTKGKLIDVAALYGISPQGELHRAKADVVLTTELFDAIIEKYGVDAVIAAAAKNQKDKEKDDAKLTPAQIADAYNGNVITSVEELCVVLGVPLSEIAFNLGKAIDDRLLEPSGLADSALVKEITRAIVETECTVSSLKPLVEMLKTKGIGADYIQTRIALLDNGIRWSTLK